MKSSRFVPYEEKKFCCGCALCQAVCPVHAIEMKLDAEGFQYPQIDTDTCVACGKCQFICRFYKDVTSHDNKNLYDTIILAAKQKNREILKKSSSGGMFCTISDYFLSNGGAIICSIYDNKINETRFILAQTKEERDRAIGSKYMQSIPGDIYLKAMRWLRMHPNKELLFMGMGCQAAAFRRFAEIIGQLDRVYIVDIICHGVPSPMIWKNFIDYRFKDQKIERLSFKDKRKGWLKPTAIAVVKGKEVLLDDYIRMFNEGCILRPSCYECPYTKIIRESDITIGDYWNIEKKIPQFYDPQGVSLVLIHSEKGQHLFRTIANNLNFCRSDSKDCYQFNLVQPTRFPEHRLQFWELYHQKGFKAVYRKYVALPWNIKIKRFIKYTLLRNTC